jgi:hypothetical protein
VKDAEMEVQLSRPFILEVTEITEEQDMGIQQATDQVEVESLT